MLDLNTLIPRCHQLSRVTGEWDLKTNRCEVIMLIVGDLVAAHQADRDERRGNLDFYRYRVELLRDEGGASFYPGIYQEELGGTADNMLAGACIQLCDFASGFELPLAMIISSHQEEALAVDQCPDNFGQCLLGITDSLVQVASAETPKEQAEEIGRALAHMDHVATQFKMDLSTLVNLRLQYIASQD